MSDVAKRNLGNAVANPHSSASEQIADGLKQIRRGSPFGAEAERKREVSRFRAKLEETQYQPANDCVC